MFTGVIGGWQGTSLTLNTKYLKLTFPAFDRLDKKNLQTSEEIRGSSRVAVC